MKNKSKYLKPAFIALFLAVIVIIFCCLSLLNKPFILIDRLDKVSEDRVLIVNNLFDRENLNQVFKKINVIRTVGSQGHKDVREFITKYLRNLKFIVEFDEFTTDTVIGPKTFTNIIANIYPFGTSPSSNKLVLSCHYDSKLIDNFYGSIDSAMPCAQILEISRMLAQSIISSNLPLALELHFYDGEEAFKDWTRTDSLYGSRHLATKFHNTVSVNYEGKTSTRLGQIDLLILLDLIGAKNTYLPNYEYCEEMKYRYLRVIENSTLKLGLLKSDFSLSGKHHFGNTARGKISDDHVPFIRRGVKVLHLIAEPFPPQWHEVSDNESNIDWRESEDLTLIFAIYVADYLSIPL